MKKFSNQRLSEANKNELLEEFREKQKTMSLKTKVVIALNILLLVIGMIMFGVGMASTPDTPYAIFEKTNEGTLVSMNNSKEEIRNKYAEAFVQYVNELDPLYPNVLFNGRLVGPMSGSNTLSSTTVVPVFNPFLWEKKDPPDDATIVAANLRFNSQNSTAEMDHQRVISFIKNDSIGATMYMRNVYVEDLADENEVPQRVYWKVTEVNATFHPHQTQKIMFTTLGLFILCTICSSLIGVAINKYIDLRETPKAWVQFLLSFSFTPLLNHIVNSLLVIHIRMDFYTVQRYVITSLFDVMVSWALTDIILTSYLAKTSKHKATDSYWVISLVSLMTYLCNSGIMRDQYVSPQGPSLFSEHSKPPMSFTGVAISVNAIIAAFLAQTALATGKVPDKILRLFIIVSIILLMSIGFILNLNGPERTHPGKSDMGGYIYAALLMVFSVVGIIYYIQTGKNKGIEIKVERDTTFGR